MGKDAEVEEEEEDGGLTGTRQWAPTSSQVMPPGRHTVQAQVPPRVRSGGAWQPSLLWNSEKDEQRGSRYLTCSAARRSFFSRAPSRCNTPSSKLLIFVVLLEIFCFFFKDKKRLLLEIGYKNEKRNPPGDWVYFLLFAMISLYVFDFLIRAHAYELAGV